MSAKMTADFDDTDEGVFFDAVNDAGSMFGALPVGIVLSMPIWALIVWVARAVMA